MEKEKSKIETPKLDIKKRSYLFALKVIDLTESLPRDQTCKVIGDQLLRSATSIGANIVEAQAGSSRRDFANFLNHALKSANETKFWLELLRDAGKKSEEQVTPLLEETKELSNILASSILTLKKKS